MNFSLLTGFQNVNRNPENKKQDEEEISQLFQILQSELEEHSPEPTFDGQYLSKEFMLSLNKLTHKPEARRASKPELVEEEE